MHYAQRLLAARPVTRAGARTILAVLTTLGVVITTAGAAAMPLLIGNEVVSGVGARIVCYPAASLNYPEGQSKQEHAVPVYGTGPGAGIDAVLTSWCYDGGVLPDPTVTVNVIEGDEVSSYPIPRLKIKLDQAVGGGTQSGFVRTDDLVDAVRNATGDQGWNVGTKLFSLTYTSGTVSATTGMFSFAGQDPDVADPPVSDATPDPTGEPTTEPTTPAPEPGPSGEPTSEPTSEPTQTSSPRATATAEPDPAATATVEPSVAPSAETTEVPTTAPEPTAAPMQSSTPVPKPSIDPAPSPSVSPSPVSSQSPTALSCQAEPVVDVLNPDGSSPKGGYPAYSAEHSIRVTGRGWCESGEMLDGDKTIEIKLIAYGGYGVPRTASVPVTFTKGSFDAQLSLPSLYGGANLTTNRYFLQVSPIGTDLSKATNVFSYEAPTAPEPTPAPTPERSPAPSAEPSSPPSSPSAESSGNPSAESSTRLSPSVAPQQGSGPALTGPNRVNLNRGSTSGDAPQAASGTDGPGSGSSSGSAIAEQSTDHNQDKRGVQRGDGSDSSGGIGSSSSQDVESSDQASAGTTAEDRTVRPDKNPIPPVTSAAQLSADNAGSLSGSRQGDVVNLVLPKAKASAGEWVSVFVFPGATTKGWVQVDDANSVSINISTFGSGSYELAVADRDNSLLGWAKLEITSASFDPQNPGQAQLLTFPDKVPSTSMGFSANDMLLGGAGGLLVIGAGSLLVAARSGLPLRAPKTPRRLRVSRRR